jgi:LAO/AO transport system kinase
MWQQYLQQIQQGDSKALARCISLVENEVAGSMALLQLLPVSNTPVIGITGPPGAGKSTLADALIEEIVAQQARVGVLCIDPSSPFNFGALLGDRIRMSNWYNHPGVFIRSLASRGALGGLHPKIIEITDLMKAAPFDYIIIETVGVGQSEVEIAGLADITIVTLVPEAGDEVQTMKAGLMEVADIFAINKSDRPGADLFVKNLNLMLAPVFSQQPNGEMAHDIPVIKTVASEKKGIDVLFTAIRKMTTETGNTLHEKRLWLLAEKAWHLIQQKRMNDVNKSDLKTAIEVAAGNFNLYRFVQNF